eukprot:5475091-Amphidinium_carterae.1
MATSRQSYLPMPPLTAPSFPWYLPVPKTAFSCGCVRTWAKALIFSGFSTSCLEPHRRGVQWSQRSFLKGLRAKISI